MFGELDRGNHIGEPRNPDVVELAHERRIYLAAAGQIAAANFAAEQQVQRVTRRVRDSDDDVGVHDIVDQRNMLIPDALDIVFAIAVTQHGRAFGGFHCRDFSGM